MASFGLGVGAARVALEVGVVGASRSGLRDAGPHQWIPGASSHGAVAPRIQFTMAVLRAMEFGSLISPLESRDQNSRTNFRSPNWTTVSPGIID